MLVAIDVAVWIVAALGFDFDCLKPLVEVAECWRAVLTQDHTPNFRRDKHRTRTKMMQVFFTLSRFIKTIYAGKQMEIFTHGLSKTKEG